MPEEDAEYWHDIADRRAGRLVQMTGDHARLVAENEGMAHAVELMAAEHSEMRAELARLREKVKAVLGQGRRVGGNGEPAVVIVDAGDVDRLVRYVDGLGEGDAT